MTKTKTTTPRPRKPFSPEVRERAVRLVREQEDAYATEWAAIRSIAEKIGCTGETLRLWVRQAERDAGRRPGLAPILGREVEKGISHARPCRRCVPTRSEAAAPLTPTR